jgi:hypothetical protein
LNRLDVWNYNLLHAQLTKWRRRKQGQQLDLCTKARMFAGFLPFGVLADHGRLALILHSVSHAGNELCLANGPSLSLERREQ